MLAFYLLLVVWGSANLSSPGSLITLAVAIFSLEEIGCIYNFLELRFFFSGGSYLFGFSSIFPT
jgi:hypothetical protein